MPRLTEQEQQQIIRYLEADKPLPDKYRFLFFADKRELEQVWNGKSTEVSSVVLPFQVIEQVDEPRAEKDRRLQMSMFDSDSRGRQFLSARIEQVTWCLSGNVTREYEFWDIIRSINPPCYIFAPFTCGGENEFCHAASSSQAGPIR